MILKLILFLKMIIVIYLFNKSNDVKYNCTREFCEISRNTSENYILNFTITPKLYFSSFYSL